METFQSVSGGEGARAAYPGTARFLPPPWRLVLAARVVLGTGVPKGRERCCGNVNSGARRRRGGVSAGVARAPCKAHVPGTRGCALWSGAKAQQ
ncbi:hypothetical protein MHYP_G00204510 [Metynnis hypsauchen]